MLQSGCIVDRGLIVTLDDRKPIQGETVTVGDIMQTILPAIIDDIHLDNQRKQELHKQLDKCGV